MALSEYFRHAVSEGEMQHRFTLVRRAMANEGIDCLVIHNYDNFLGGYTRYFTDVPVGNYPTTILFHREDDTTFIAHGAPWTESIPRDVQRDIGQALATPLMPTLCYTDPYMPRLVAEQIRARGYKRVGLVAMAQLPASLYCHLRENLPDVELIDATTLVDRIKAIKSPEEIEKLREIVRIHDQIGAAVPTMFRPGRYEFEIVADLKKMAADYGCEGLNVGLGTSQGVPGMRQTCARYRRVEPGDNMMCLIELSGPGGYYAELFRVWSLGEPSREMVDAAECAAACQRHIVSMMKPGVRCSELFQANNDFLTAHGYGPEGRMFAHSQGLDMVERPALVADEDFTLEENMFFAVHPVAANETAFGIVCDNFLITKDGAECLTQTPKTILIC